MKTLYLLRHAKSSWGDPALPDHERPLNERGRKAAATMGCFLAGLAERPSLVLASTARRVGETLDLLLPELAGNVAVRRDKNLYLAAPHTLLSRLQSTSEIDDNLMIVGHNPGIHQFALQLLDEPRDKAEREARRRLEEAYPTAALTVLRFPAAQNWGQIAWGEGRLLSFTTPRALSR